MAKYRRRPIVVEAVQWTGPETKHKAVGRFLDTAEGIEGWTKGRAGAWGKYATEFYGIRTLEGTMRLSPGDWVITGTHGEFYPCKPDIFADGYDAA